MARTVRWTPDTVREELRKYSSRTEFLNSNKYLSRIIRDKFKDIYDEELPSKIKLKGHRVLKRGMTIANCLEVARGFPDRTTFRTSRLSEYNFLNRNGVDLTEIYGELDKEPTNKIWTEVSIRKEASKYTDRGSFSIQSPSAYVRCTIICPHVLDELFDRGSAKNNVAYLWRSSSGWWKYGVTSSGLGKSRPIAVSKSSNTTIEELYMWDVEKATDYEKQISQTGDPIFHKKLFDGSTECRYFHDYEVEQAIQLGDSMGTRTDNMPEENETERSSK